jgi:hypothetical protein
MTATTATTGTMTILRPDLGTSQNQPWGGRRVRSVRRFKLLDRKIWIGQDGIVGFRLDAGRGSVCYIYTRFPKHQNKQTRYRNRDCRSFSHVNPSGSLCGNHGEGG